MTATASTDLSTDLITDSSTKDRYERDGFVVLEQALTPAEVAALNAEVVAMVKGELGPVDGSPVGPGATEAEALAATLCVHFPHKLSPLFAAALRHPAVVPVLVDLLSPDVKCMQSMAFVKSEGKPGQAWHQDEQFIPTRDRCCSTATCCTARCRTTAATGCAGRWSTTT
jgi:ectoine hydroxylase-related dioxygenase (phytanoyl-CoA dioxygenase family)